MERRSGARPARGRTSFRAISTAALQATTQLPESKARITTANERKDQLADGMTTMTKPMAEMLRPGEELIGGCKAAGENAVLQTAVGGLASAAIRGFTVGRPGLRRRVPCRRGRQGDCVSGADPVHVDHVGESGAVTDNRAGLGFIEWSSSADDLQQFLSRAVDGDVGVGAIVGGDEGCIRTPQEPRVIGVVRDPGDSLPLPRIADASRPSSSPVLALSPIELTTR